MSRGCVILLNVLLLYSVHMIGRQNSVCLSGCGM